MINIMFGKKAEGEEGVIPGYFKAKSAYSGRKSVMHRSSRVRRARAKSSYPLCVLSLNHVGLSQFAERSFVVPSRRMVFSWYPVAVGHVVQAFGCCFSLFGLRSQEGKRAEPSESD